MNNLLPVLQTHLGASFSPINSVKKSCCVSTVPVIEFDDVKDNFCTTLSIPNHAKLCSADCLYINDSKRTICFIEMKSAAQAISNAQAEHPTDPVKSDEVVNAWLNNKVSSLRLKISDSIFLITAALGKYSPGTSDIPEILDKSDVKIRYVTLLDITQSEFTKYNIASLANKVSHGLLAGVTCRAVMIPASDFDDYVSRLL